MKTLRFLLEKEFRQIRRNPAILRIIFVMPLIQLLVLPWAANYEVKHITLSVVDHDHSGYSRQLVNKIGSTRYFIIVENSNNYRGALNSVAQNRADLILEIPPAFERTLVRENEAGLFMAVNAINGVKANLGAAYLRSIIQDYNRDVRMKWIQFPRFSSTTTIEVRPTNWFNPQQDYKFFMVPGIMVILITLVGIFLTAMNIVKEKEVGTIEQVNVSPIKKHHFILGKMIPFWLLGMLVLTIGLFVIRLAYGITPAGSIFTIYIFAAVFLAAVLGLGLMVSSFAATQQQAMLISFFILMIFVLLSGLYTSIESMPVWAQWITKLNPVTYFIEVMRMVILKGSSLADILPKLGIMVVFALVLNVWAVLMYRKQS